ncbi:MAG TPA: lipopolysaccharide biosynthesis protein [Pseudomonas xinjiangensis]|uniref:Lipopolysaccharide biosynthesis protein n=2 Tax=root TaxID=1 RepID=A0A7V1BR30_9GAMM|nr:lipopolysaccharide biosynthesis protein [Halopseudomonas xinjiangensis]HEC47893.1 lipopolysaccharide biosynthesis protein [Halopseudomonas xinjiangensis]
MAEHIQTGEVDIKNAGRLATRLKSFSDLLREQLRSKLLRNIMTVVSGTAGAQALTMLFMPIITRLYGPESYGVLGVFMGLVMMLVPIAALTYPMAIVLPKRDADARAIVKLSLILAVVVALVLAVILHFFGEAIVGAMGVEEITPFLMLLPIVMLFGASLESAQQWLIRKQLFHVTAKVAVMHSFAHNLIRSAGGLIYATPAMLVITTAFGPLLHATMLLLGIRNRNARQPIDQDRRREEPTHLLKPARQYVDFPKFRAPQMLINAVSQNLPTLVLAAYFGPAAAGFFALCKQTLSMPTHLIGKSVADVYYPRITQAIQRKEPITPMLAKAIAGLALVGLIPFGTVFLIGPWLFSFVFGSEWEVAGEFARWLALAEYAIFVSRPCTVAFPALSMQRISLKFEIVSTTLRTAALFVGAVLLEGELSTVIAFTTVSIVIYLSLVVILLTESRRRYARGYC